MCYIHRYIDQSLDTLIDNEGFFFNLPSELTHSRADIVYSARFGTPPSFPSIFPTTSPFDVFLMGTISIHPHGLYPLTIFTSQCMHGLLQTLRNITYSVDDPLLSLSMPRRKVVSDTLHVTELQILASEHNSPSFCCDTAIFDEESTTLSRAFTLSALLYLHLAIRSLAPSSQLHTRLLSQLLILLHGVSWGDLASEHAADIMLWCVFVACAATRDPDVRMELIALVHDADPEFWLMKVEDVRARLKRVVWRGDGWDGILDGLW